MMKVYSVSTSINEQIFESTQVRSSVFVKDIFYLQTNMFIICYDSDSEWRWYVTSDNAQ